MASAHDCRQMVRDDDRRLILHQSVERLLRFGDELVCIGQFRGGAFSHPAATRDAAAPRTSSLVPLNKASDEDGLRAGRPSFQERVPHADHESKEPPIGEARHPVRVARSKIATNGPAYDLRCALVTAARGNQRMSDTPQNDKSKQQIRHLRELIAALDKRVPRIERVGEASIARDAAALKKKALERLAELQADVEE